MRKAYVLVVIGVCVLSGCVSGGVVIHWQKTTLADVNAICNANVPPKHRKDVWACYKRSGNQCFVYTASPESGEDPRIHDTLGHEVRHCFEGAWH